MVGTKLGNSQLNMGSQRKSLEGISVGKHIKQIQSWEYDMSDGRREHMWGQSHDSCFFYNSIPSSFPLTSGEESWTTLCYVTNKVKLRSQESMSYYSRHSTKGTRLHANTGMTFPMINASPRSLNHPRIPNKHFKSLINNIWSWQVLLTAGTQKNLFFHCRHFS